MIECKLGEQCGAAVRQRAFEEWMREEEAKRREADEALERAHEAIRRSGEILRRIESAGTGSLPRSSSGGNSSGKVISLDVSLAAGAGLRGGGGMSISVGMADSGDVSVALTGSANGGIETGGGATVNIGVSVRSLGSAVELSGESLESGLAFSFGVGGSAGVITDPSGTPIGGAVALSVGGRGGVEGGLAAYGTAGTTSVLVGWDQRTGLVLFAHDD